MKHFTQSGIFAIAFWLVALCAACVAQPPNGNSPVTESSKTESSKDQLAGTKWRLLQLGDPAITPDAEITLSFSGGSLMGHSGCNDYSGSYRLTGETIQIHDTIVTTMACKETLRMEQETLYLEALAKVNKFKRQAEQLTLFDQQEKPILIFDPIAEK